MAETLLMPTLGLTMTEGTVDQWYKAIGDTVKKGEAVVSISSEKLTHDVESPIDGVLLNITVQEGGEVPCQDVIGYVGAEGEVIVAEENTVQIELEKKEEPISEVKQVNELKVVTKQSHGRIFATPLARKMAADKSYNIEDIPGTGGNGRVTKRDVNRFVPIAKQTVNTVTTGEGLTGMRKVIAQRMRHSLETTAQLTLHRKADITNLLIFRNELKEKSGATINRSTLSINTLLVKGVAKALKDYPEMNASYDGDEHLLNESVHMGIAVAVDEGLVVPVLKDVEIKSLSQIGEDFTRITSQAIDGSLSSELYSGSTFTITNLGSMGVEYFTPILNTPEIGILGVGSTTSKLVFNDAKQVTEIQELPLSLTFDHQALDGVPAAEFFGKIVYYLENPYLLIV